MSGPRESAQGEVRAFLLTCAVRDVRGHGGGRSMLVNVTRFKSVQRQCHELVESRAVSLKCAIEFHADAYANGSPNAALASSRRLRGALRRRLHLAGGLGRLHAAVSDVRVELINSDRDKKLTDDEVAWDRPQMIAVGGDVRAVASHSTGYQSATSTDRQGHSTRSYRWPAGSATATDTKT